MMSKAPIRRRSSEEGYILIWVIFLLAIFTISLSVAVPAISKEIERDRERETMARGKQYQRAIQLYYKKFHAYPPNVNALVNTNQIRFLRKKYIDPMTGKDDWKPILFGQAKTQTLGFFGQPLAGAASAGYVLAGIGPSGGNGWKQSRLRRPRLPGHRIPPRIHPLDRRTRAERPPAHQRIRLETKPRGRAEPVAMAPQEPRAGQTALVPAGKHSAAPASSAFPQGAPSSPEGGVTSGSSSTTRLAT